MTVPAPVAAVDLALPADPELMAGGAPDPRAQAARLTATGDPGAIRQLARRLVASGTEMDEAHLRSRQTQRAVAAGLVNDGSPVYDESTHLAALPAGFPDTGTALHDAGRRLTAVADELAAATAEVSGRLARLDADLNAWRRTWTAEVRAACGANGRIPVERLPALRARWTDVIGGMREAVDACGRAIAARIDRYDQLLGGCARLLGEARAALGGAPGPTAPAGPTATPVPGIRGETSGLPPPTPPTPGFAVLPGGPSILSQPVPIPVPALPDHPVAPPVGPAVTVVAPDLGLDRTAARPRPTVPSGPPPPNLAPPGAGRAGAFGQAKRDSGIPVSMPPTRVLPNLDRGGRLRPGRVYEFDVRVPDGDGDMRTVWIRDDAGGDSYPDDPRQDRGPHFNTMDKGHYDY